MLQCNLTFTKLSTDSFWATNTVTIIQYCIMLVVAAAAFASNFAKKKSLRAIYLITAVIALVVFCYMAPKQYLQYSRFSQLVSLLFSATT